MQNDIYPKFDNHSDVHCFHCAAPIGHGKPINYGFPRGRFGIWCEACCLRTYYDTDDQSIKFDKKGDPLTPACACGCTVPYGDWPYEEYSGFHMCPDCGMV